MNIVKKTRAIKRLRARSERDNNYTQALSLAATMRTAGMTDEKAILSIKLAHDLSTKEARRVWRQEKPRKHRARK